MGSANEGDGEFKEETYDNPFSDISNSIDGAAKKLFKKRRMRRKLLSDVTFFSFY